MTETEAAARERDAASGVIRAAQQLNSVLGNESGKLDAGDLTTIEIRKRREDDLLNAMTAYRTAILEGPLVAQLTEALRAEDAHGAPRYLVYLGEDSATCVVCGAYGGNPFVAEDVEAWPHIEDCAMAAALAAADAQKSADARVVCQLTSADMEAWNELISESAARREE